MSVFLLMQHFMFHNIYVEEAISYYLIKLHELLGQLHLLRT